MLRDSDNPISGWDVAAVQKSGYTYGVDPADVYGSLFFHVKDEFIKFATHFRNFKISITLTQFDALDLPRCIVEGMLQPFHKSCFDRIETSNLADYVTIPYILDDWSPLLNRQNKHATLMMSLMNWRQKEGLFESGLKMDKGTTQKYASIIVSRFHVVKLASYLMEVPSRALKSQWTIFTVTVPIHKRPGSFR